MKESKRQVSGATVMKRNEFHYKSCDGVTQIHAVEWIPSGEIRAVLQICHGMIEHIRRYDEFAQYLTERGFYVVGHDHLGHGGSVQSREDYGYFGEPDGNVSVIGDIHKLRWWTQKRCENVPYFMLGHSMGSFLLRQYLLKYSEGLSGAILMGTGYHSSLELTAGQFLCRAIAAVKGWRYRSRLVNAIGFGGFNRKFQPCETDKDWLTTDRRKREEYINDPYCSFVFTVNGYYHMFRGMKTLEKKNIAGNIKKDLPVFFVSGADDPVGSFGKGVEKIYERYRQAGMKDVEIHLYRDDRHEILNERNRAQVFEDIYLWLEDKM